MRLSAGGAALLAARLVAAAPRRPLCRSHRSVARTVARTARPRAPGLERRGESPVRAAREWGRGTFATTPQRLCSQGYEYCFAGVQACPPHTGPAIHCTQVLTTLAFIAGFVFLRGCFLFPCLCAPELPAWLFFPPDNPPPNPIGEGDIDWQAAMLMLSRALRGFPPPEDCVWAPPVGEAPATELWRHAGAWGL